MIVRFTIIDRTEFSITVTGNNFIKFHGDIVKAGGIEVIQDGYRIWYPISAIRSVKLVQLT